jgi:hypothetical protein
MKGVFKSFIYYSIGLGLAGLSYLTIGQGYIHAPGLHHIIILLTFLGGILWLIGAVGQYFSKERTENLKGIILTNTIVTLSFVFYMGYVLDDSSESYESDENLMKLKVTQSGDTITMHHGGSIVYWKVRDSVLLNFIDSANVDWSEVQLEKK